jgi:hypothetical protein
MCYSWLYNIILHDNRFVKGCGGNILQEVMSMRLKNQEPWGADVADKMQKLRLTKRDIAGVLGMNYEQCCNIINGNVKNAKHKARIIECIGRLWAERGA